MLLISVHVVLVFFLGSKAEDLILGKDKEYLISEAAKMDLMELDKNLILNLVEYSNELKEKITKLQRLAREIRQPLDAARGVEEEYLSNPLHSFPLIRHMHQDWKYLEEFIRKPVGQAQIDFLKGILPGLPTQADSKEAILSMDRLARTYNATPWDMADGLIDGIKFNGTLTALDIFEMGKFYFQCGLFREATMWFMHRGIYEDYEGFSEVLGFRMNDVALMLARSLMEMDLFEEAHDVLMDMPDLEKNATNLLALYRAHPYQPRDKLAFLPENYAKLCRSSHAPSPSRLHCRYNTTTSPFLILAPLKMEELSLDPYIVVYHDVLSAEITEEIIRFGEPKMEPTYVVSKELGEIKNTGRTALGTWLSRRTIEPSDEPLLRYINQRLKDVSGLKIRELHSVQLVKYGSGAHYSPHFDYFNISNTDTKGEGDRIATVLFYLNDAPHGGATTFPKLNLKVNAERGKVLFWYNTKGETHDFDETTLHGACPVFKGLKYVMTAWIDEWDQMFIQPTYREGNRNHFI